MVWRCVPNPELDVQHIEYPAVRNSQTGGVGLGRINITAKGIAAPDLEVATNAASGFTVYARYSGTLSDGLGHSVADVSGSNTGPVSFPLPGVAAFGYTTSESALGTARSTGSSTAERSGARSPPRRRR